MKGGLAVGICIHFDKTLGLVGKLSCRQHHFIR